MAGSNRLRWVLDSRLLVRGWAAIFFYCLGMASRIMRAASCGSLAVASTSLARVSRYDASSVWVMLSISISRTSCPVDSARFPSVSYTHLDVYKRQEYFSVSNTNKLEIETVI